MQRWKEGDRVRITERTATPADTKTGLYYNYYAGLTGTVFKLYGNGPGTQAAIEVDITSLPDDVARRHREVRDQMLSSLTGDARRQSLVGGAHEFNLRYVILVGIGDLTRPTARRLVKN
jgi:hypothetical protein